MSTINTSVSRATTVPRQQLPKRRREPLGALGAMAEADQRGGGLFERLFPDRFGGGTTTPTTPATTPRARRLTPVPAGETTTGEFDIAFPGVSGVGTTVFEGLSDAEKAAVLEAARVRDESNTILDKAKEPLQQFIDRDDPLLTQTRESLSATLADPEAISDQAARAAISAATDAILGRERDQSRLLTENLAARGISDSGLSFALAQAGTEASGRDIATARRDVLLQQELARSGREAQIQETAGRFLGTQGGFELQAAGGISGLTAEETVAVIPFQKFADSAEFKALMEATDEEDFERRVNDFMATFGLGALELALGQGVNTLL